MEDFVSKGDQVDDEVADIEGRVTYQRIRVKGGIDLTPQAWHQGGSDNVHGRGENIIGQGRGKEEKGRGLSGGYQHEGGPFYKWVVSWH